ncbi:MAG: hypothetical protein ACKPCP_36460 [Sphaerospermopsis kisseleviana]
MSLITHNLFAPVCYSWDVPGYPGEEKWIKAKYCKLLYVDEGETCVSDMSLQWIEITPPRCLVYFIGSGDFIGIGVTATSQSIGKNGEWEQDAHKAYKKRMQSYKVPDLVEYGYFESSKKYEFDFKKDYQFDRAASNSKEWFNLSFEMGEEIIRRLTGSHCDTFLFLNEVMGNTFEFDDAWGSKCYKNICKLAEKIDRLDPSHFF